MERHSDDRALYRQLRLSAKRLREEATHIDLLASEMAERLGWRVTTEEAGPYIDRLDKEMKRMAFTRPEY